MQTLGQAILLDAILAAQIFHLRKSSIAELTDQHLQISEIERLSFLDKYRYGKKRVGINAESVSKKLLQMFFVDKDDNHYDCFTLFSRLLETATKYDIIKQRKRG